MARTRRAIGCASGVNDWPAARGSAMQRSPAACPLSVVFGAGSVGRGFLGQLFSESGYEVLFVDILSEAGRPCRLQNPFDDACLLSDLNDGCTRELAGDVLSFSTRPGGRYRLTRTGSPLADGDVAFQLAKRPREEQNWFGLKTHPRF